MRNCIAPLMPTLEQVEHYRRTGRVPKVDIAKSAGSKVAVYDSETGEVLGYGERIDMSKSARIDGLGLGLGTNGTTNKENDEGEGNEVFDSLFLGLQPCGVSEVAKSAELEDDPTAEFMSCFPLCLQNS